MKRLGLSLALIATGCTVQVNNPEIGSRNRLDAQGRVDVRANVNASPSPAHTPTPRPTNPSGSTEATSSPTPVSIPTFTPTPGPLATLDPTIPEGTPTPTPDGRYHPPSFVSLKTVPVGAHIDVLNYSTVVIASGPTLSITTDAGKTWIDHMLPRSLRAMHWTSAERGWGITDGNAMWRFDVVGGRLTQEALTPLAIGSPVQIHFIDENTGFVSSSTFDVLRTNNGGKTWTNAVKLDGVTVGFYGIGSKDFSFVDTYGNLHVWGNGGFMQTQLKANGLKQAVGTVGYADGRLVAATKISAAIAMSDDGSTFSYVNRDIRTSTQMLPGVVSNAFPITRDVWVGQAGWNLTLTRDAGVTWLEPSQEKMTLAWLKPFSETDMWGAVDDSTNITLYRSGRP